MTGVHKPLQWTQTDAIVEALSAESCHIVLETSPPDYVEKISRYLESSVGHGGQDAGPNDPAEEESDSGDSLFITQKPIPEAVRSQRRCRYNLKSDSSPARDLEESGDDTSSSDSHEESRAAKRRQAKRIRPPKFSFPFLTDRKSKPMSTQLSARQSAALHNYAMGGFLRCVRELWQSYQGGDDVQSSLPTVDMDGENIPPLSEEEESSESEDIKVVERKCFVAPSKSKCSQPWYTPGKRDFEVKRQRSSQRARQEGRSQDRQRKKLHKIPVKRSTSRVTAPSSDTESSDNGDPSHRVLMERETSDKHMTCDRSIAAHTKTPTTKARLTGGNKEILPQEKESEEELCGDSDATMCEALEWGSPREYTLNDREPCPNVTEPPADVFHTDSLSETGQEEDEPESQSLLQSLPDLISDTNNDKTRVKNKKKAKGDDDSVEGGRGQSHEEPEGLHAAASVNVEEEETPSPSEDHPAEPPAPQTSDETQLSEENPSHDDIIPRQEERLSPGSKRMKKKRKKKKAADNIREEEDGNLKSDVRSENDSLFSVTCNMVNDGKEEKKKKRERSVEDDEGVEQLIPLNEDAETGRKKKKRKKEKLTVNMEEDEEEEALTSDRPLSSERQLEEKENSDVPRETLEKKRKKQKKKQLLASHEEAEVGADGGTDLSSNNDVTLEGSTGQSVKKTKKKRRESICEGEDISSTPDKNKKLNNAGNCQKTDEGPDDQDTELGSKKKNEMISRNVSEDAATQSDDSVSVRKKEKKRTSSFLAADAEEKEAETHEEQTSVAAHVWDAERPGVSAGEFQTESAEIAGNLETSNDGVRKKKRKRKMSMVQENVEEGHRQDVKEPNKTCESALPENTNTGVKRKKKRRRNESESVTPMERLDSAAEAGCPAADEATVLKKKKKKEKTQESPPAATDDAESEEATLKNCSSVSHKRKGKHSTSALVTKEIDGDSAEMSHDGGTSDKTSKETLNMAEPASPSSETPGNPELNHVREKKKKKKGKSTDNVLLERKLSTESVEIETHKSKKKERNKTSVPSFMSSSPVLSQSEVSSSDCSRKNKPKKAKRRLHNPSEDFFSDY